MMTADSLLDVLGELFADEISIVVSNTREYIYYRPSKRVDLKIRPGDLVKEGSLAYKALTEGHKISEFIHRDMYGVPYHGMAVPFYDNHSIEGSVVAIYPAYTEGKSVVTLKTADGWVPVPFSEVKYLEVRERKTIVVSDRITGTHKNSLQNFEFILPHEQFIRCHRSYIVNVTKISEIYPDTHSTFLLRMNDGAEIPVSQSYSSYFRKMLDF
ncbi:LytTR family DNA-binding domain-containing protein [Sporosarcina oncorhynchi]|uniref:LytTR family DNA-binding domain-containing protein n=1 Tax=Sporosarcina oncorhynchi TaxID=3056444 RepID=A0ABZ0L4F1_9BACL|nr:LytTR family DNA-binding domain-containing protein [Sporosarcina sp. T2O-4]WOV87475.1 LytTR family DNA-binding domain-containing protein [Sporosarcina sp. T2O-4]